VQYDFMVLDPFRKRFTAFDYCGLHGPGLDVLPVPMPPDPRFYVAQAPIVRNSTAFKPRRASDVQTVARPADPLPVMPGYCPFAGNGHIRYSVKKPDFCDT
jgi:hypothetical protein